MENQALVDLLDYRRRVSAQYLKLRTATGSLDERCADFRLARDELFASHPQSALTKDQKAQFRGLDYFAYDASWRLLLDIDRDVEPEIFEVTLKDDGVMRMRRMGRIHFARDGQSYALSLFWIMGYGGGLFLPFRDLSHLTEGSYEGTRYLIDSIKGADLGEQDRKLLIDFNYAYNPSCAYNAQWDCPLAPKENWLELSIPVGEKAFLDAI